MVDALQNIKATHSVIGHGDTAASQPAPRAPTTGSSQQPEYQASPRLELDPVVGVIVQFLGTSGTVESQTPSFAAAAYLRAGLAADGFRKESGEDSVQVTA